MSWEAEPASQLAPHGEETLRLVEGGDRVGSLVLVADDELLELVTLFRRYQALRLHQSDQDEELRERLLYAVEASEPLFLCHLVYREQATVVDRALG